MVWLFGTSRLHSAQVPPRLCACVGHEVMPGSMLSSYTPTHLTPNPFHLAPPQRSLLIRRHRSKNPGSVGHKHGPRIESVFQAQNWDRVRKWCKISGPESGHKNSGATSSSQPTSWLARALDRPPVHVILKAPQPFLWMLLALGYYALAARKHNSPYPMQSITWGSSEICSCLLPRHI